MHARRTARDAFFPSREDDAFFAPRRGDIVFHDGAAVRAFADRVNRGEARPEEVALRPAELASMALAHEVLHAVVRAYRGRHPSSFARLTASLEASLGPGARQIALEFLEAFPPPPVYRALRGEGDDVPQRYLERMAGPELAGGAQGRAGAEAEIDEELLLLWVASQNPAYDPVRTIIGDGDLGRTYPRFVREVQRFFDGEPRFGPKGETLVDLLLAPARAHPTSIFAQLEYIDRMWREAFGLDALALRRRLAWTEDLRVEDDTWFHRGGPGPGEPLLEPMRFSAKAEGDGPARFSPDLNWMPNVVLIAKSVYVWLDQLAKKYGRDVRRLDQVPDEELDLLAARGLNGLWLIGLFERSAASRKVKQMCGDHDALASAYSLKRYEIAQELGGAPAYEDLKARAWARGVRLAADMVPNHVGVDGDWVIDHPDWFLQTPRPPFPKYRFGGPDLAESGRVGIFLEEGYWDKTDAAVVFRRHDARPEPGCPEDRFLYHGNDGTSMPWNDTAQLDYLKAEVRQAVIETILHVARMFPIIRFDAAMTLAKRHIQRLWYPLPGQGGAIPSRADYAMTQEEFDAAIPVEFWREVVDTVAARAPDTLLLAEAFWMMEGYFVRTLGMHRVYNSAFMNMLKREENDKYRATIKNVLDFDPEILKRFVNFMNNPDEETAALQFGDDDKYFGTCVLMSTLPGLPMFGHGQIEGFREKYGMEYRRARWQEEPNEHLVRRHEREIFPLLHERYLFSGVERFALYDFVTDGGQIDEDVYAYSNGAGGERALVLFNNKWKTTRGRIFASTHRGDVASELGLDVAGSKAESAWLVLRDLPRGLEYLRRARDIVEGGVAWELQAFQYHVLSGFRLVNATFERPYDRLAAELAGRGAPDIERAARELSLRPIHAPLRDACSKGHIEYLTAQLDADDVACARAALEERLGNVAAGLDWMLARRSDRDAAIDVAIDRAAAIRAAGARFAVLHAVVREAALSSAAEAGDASVLHVDLLLALIQVEAVLDLLVATTNPVPTSEARDEAATASARPRSEAAEIEPANEVAMWPAREAAIAQWELATPLAAGFGTIVDANEARRRTALVLLAATLPTVAVLAVMRLALGTERGQRYMDVHESEGTRWLNKERFEELVRFLAERELASGLRTHGVARSEADALVRLAEREGYRVERIASSLGPAPNVDAPPPRR